MTSFIGFLTENRTVDVMMTRMANELEVIDKDMGNVFVVRDKKLGDLTGKEHTFDVRFHGHGDIEVHPHNETDHDRAAEIERKLTESAKKPVFENNDERRAAILADMKKQHAHNKPEWAMTDEEKAAKKERVAKGRAKAKAAYERDEERRNGPDWKAKRDAKTAKSKADYEAHVKAHPNGWDGYAKSREERARKNDGWTGD